MRGKEIALPGQKGSLTWQFDQWRRHALTALFDDLVLAETAGFRDDDCTKVRQALELCANRAVDLGDRSIHYQMERLVLDYEKWNNPTGEDPKTVSARRKRMRALRKRKAKLANRTSRNAQVIEEHLDKEFVRAQYDALNGIVRALPKQFEKLADVLRKQLG